jgi:hypothetical protein
VEQKPDQNVIPVESWALNGITFGHIFRETAMTIHASVSTEQRQLHVLYKFIPIWVQDAISLANPTFGFSLLLKNPFNS